MFECKGTEKFDIGAGFGEYEYDFFAGNGDDDFWAIVNHYCTIYGQFDYFLEGNRIVENNTDLSPAVKAKMKEHNANFCLTFLKEDSFEKNVDIKIMVVNELTTDSIYNTHLFLLIYHAK